MLRALLIGGLCLLAAPSVSVAQVKAPPPDAEWREMLMAIMAGQMGPTDGWFKPSVTRYGWEWANRHDADKNGAVARDEMALAEAAFDRLDRDGDGRLTAVDFDWSEKSPLNSKTAQARQWLMRADQDKDGKLSADEWARLFEQAAKGQEQLDLENVRKLLFPPAPPAPSAAKGKPSDMPSAATLLQGLYSGEIGSPFPGPNLDDFAPDFTLPTHDGAKSVNLRSFRNNKPVALIFGSFT
jgi:Ca2+-binding EF-hand superfamily protein